MRATATNQAPSAQPDRAAARTFEAVVTAAVDGSLEVRRADRQGRIEARNAVHGYAPTSGDRVLCTAHGDTTYVTGVLVAAPPALRLAGATARVEDGHLVVRADDGTIVVRFDPASGETRVRADHSALTLEASERLELRAPDVTVEADRLIQRVGRLTTEAGQVSTSTQRWDLRAGQVTERARNVFRDVRDLLQTRAGTLRSIARGSVTLFGQRTTVRSKDDTSIDGARVLLG